MVICEGNYAIIRRGNVWMLAQVIKNRPVMFCKQKLNLGGSISKNYGSVFEVKGGHLHIVEEELSKRPCKEDSPEARVLDNRFLLDDGKSQKLTKDDIETMKQEGLSGEEIVKTLVENSSTFQSKTQFAQQKYLKKKQDKYGSRVVLLQPNTRLLAEMYYMQGPLKICNLRVDSLSQMLTMTNVIASGKYIVVDSCQGLLVAAVLERLNSEGCVIQLHPGPGPVSSYRRAVDALNYTPEYLTSVLCGMTIGKAVQLIRAKSPTETDSPEGVTQDDNDDSEIPMSEDSPVQRKERPEKYLEKAKRKALRVQEEAKAKEILLQKNIDGFLIASKHHPTNIVLDLLDFLAPSRPFAVFSPFMQPLVDCYEQVKCSGSCVFLKFSETWLRKYQILPDRTHPDISISGSGGYLLTGIKVVRREQSFNQT